LILGYEISFAADPAEQVLRTIPFSNKEKETFSTPADSITSLN